MFQSLPSRGHPVIAHASYKSLGAVDGGPQAVIDALLDVSSGLMMPAFTYDTMVSPLAGPPNNATAYSEEPRDLTTDTGPVAFRPDLPSDPDMGIVAETLRRQPDAKRSLHPILSFSGVNVEFALDRQTIFDPFAPIAAFAEQNGWVMLIGVGHQVNTSIHYAEKLAGRKQFVRWALMPKRVVECPGFPGDSFGFDAIREHLKNDVDIMQVGAATVEVMPLNRLIEKAKMLIEQEPLALLCQRPNCVRCQAVRDSL